MMDIAPLPHKSAQDCAEWIRSVADEVAAKLEPIYALLGWTWGYSVRSPSQNEIASMIREMATTVQHQNFTRPYFKVESGGIEVGWKHGPVGADTRHSFVHFVLKRETTYVAPPPQIIFEEDA